MRLTDPKFPWTWPFFFTSPWSNSHSEEEQTLQELARENSLAKCCSFINIVSCSPGWASIFWRNFLRYHWAQVFSNSTSQNNSSLYFPLIEERSQYWHLEPCLWLTDFKHGLFYWSIYGTCESILKAERWWLPKHSPALTQTYLHFSVRFKNDHCTPEVLLGPELNQRKEHNWKMEFLMYVKHL